MIYPTVFKRPMASAITGVVVASGLAVTGVVIASLAAAPTR